MQELELHELVKKIQSRKCEGQELEIKRAFKDCFAYRWMKKRYINYQISETNL